MSPMPHQGGPHAAILARYQERVRQFDAIAERRAPASPEPVVWDARPVRLPSGRELEVLRHVADGCSGKQIALRMELSEETVKSHVRSLIAKLGARNRTHAVAIGLRAGLIEGAVAA